MKNGLSKTTDSSRRPRASRCETGSVHVPVDPILLPLEGEDVEGVGDRDAQVVGVADAAPAAVPRAVDRPEDLVRVAAELLHDVDLAAARPAHLADVGAERPERRPQSGAGRDFDAGLDAAVADLDLVLRDQAPSVLHARSSS
jgi:hypothetical protein